jgi:hypothetical protein
VVDYLAIVLPVDDPLRRHGHVGLELGEEGGQRRRATGGICSCGLRSGVAVVAVMLGEDGWDVLEDERRKILGTDALVEGADYVGEDGGDLGQQVLVVAGELGPPGRDVGAEGEGDEVVELGGEFWGDIRGGEEGGRLVARLGVEEEAAGEGRRHSVADARSGAR